MRRAVPVRGESLQVIRKFLRGGSVAVIGKIATYPLGLLLTMLFARVLTTADVGAYFLVMSTAMLGSGIVQAGLATTMCKRIAHALAHDNPAGARKTIRIGVTALAIGTAVTFVILDGSGGRWLMSQVDGGEALVDALFWIAAMVVLFAATNYCCEILRGFNELPSAALLDQQLLQRSLLFAALIVPVLMSFELDLLAVLRMSAVAALFSALTGALLIARHVSALPKHGPGIETGTVLREAPTFFLMRMNAWLLNSAAIWILGFSRPLEETALYGAANAIALLVLAAWQVISAAIGPTVVRLHADKDSEALQTVLRTAATLAALPGLLLTALLVSISSAVLALLFTPQYAPAAGILTILACGRAASTFFGSPMILLSMTEHRDTVFRILLVSSLVTLAVYVLVAPTYGAVGVALATAISVVAQAALLAVHARRKLGVNTLPIVSPAAWRSFVKHLGT